MEHEEMMEHGIHILILTALTVFAFKLSAFLLPNSGEFDGFPYPSWWVVAPFNIIVYPTAMLISIVSFEGSWNEYLFGYGDSLTPAEWFITKHVMFRFTSIRGNGFKFLVVWFVKLVVDVIILCV